VHELKVKDGVKGGSFRTQLSQSIIGLRASLITLKKTFITFSLFISCITFAQSNLPYCSSRPFYNCYGGKKYDNGKYLGEWLNNLRHGQGTFVFSNGSKYVGQWLNDQYDGQGTFTFANGDTYVGQFKHAKLDGQGTYLFANGNTYVGQWQDGNKNGQGEFSFTGGAKYEGQFRADNYNGQGIFTFANGDKYVGEFKDDNYDGYGTLYYADGTIYQQGNWRNGNFVKEQNPSTVISAEVPQLPAITSIPKPPAITSNPQEIKRQKCISLGLAPGSKDFQQCMN